jgi:hypothetical protein
MWSALFAISLQATSGPTGAVTPAHVSIGRPVAAPAQRAGVFHVASGVWHAGVGASGPGPTVIYNSSCVSDPVYFFDLDSGWSLTDEGRIPSPTGPSDEFWNRPGCATSYFVNGFEIGYCTDRPTVDVDIRFIEHYGLCSNPNAYPTLAAFHLPGLPGSSGGGQFACWIVTVDLSGGAEFTIAADGDGTYSPTGTFGELSGSSDRFGWTIEFSGATGVAGPIMAGQSTPTLNPCSARSFDGTSFDPIVDLAEPGVGMSTTDFFWLDEGSFEYCRYFTYGGYYLRLLSGTTCPPRPGSAFCFGDGTGTPCPCQPPMVPVGFREGCRNGTAGASGRYTAGVLLAEGTASLGADTLVLRAAGLRPNTTALFFQGTQAVQGGLGSQFGDGLRCAGGTTRRLGMRTALPSGTISYPAPGDAPVSVRGLVGAPGNRTYQVWYRVAQDWCTPSTFNLTNGWELSWTP